MMKILFTDSDLPGSRLIKWVTNAPVSHVAIAHRNKVFHSVGAGMSIETLEEFKAKRRIRLSVEVDVAPERIQEFIAKWENARYDYVSLVYAGLCILRRKFFGIPLPKKSRVNNNMAFTCTELATKLLNGEEDSFITPYELYLKLKDR